jgi:hypothetical protein
LCSAQIRLDSSLISHFTLNDSATDKTGNTNPVVSGIKFVSGKCGISKSAARFDGQNDFIRIGKFDELSDSLGSFSVSFWMKQHISSVSAYESIMGSLNSGSNTALDVKVHHGSGNSFTKNGISLQIRDENNKYFTLTITKIDSLFDGAWHHVIFNIIDAKNNKGNVYIDNKIASLTNTTNTSPDDFSNFQNDFCIGATNNRGTISRYFTGELDEIRFYARPLDSLEVDSLFKQRCTKSFMTYDTTKIITYDTVSVFDTTTIFFVDTFYRIIDVYDTILVFDTLAFVDTITHYTYDTIQKFDTTEIILIDTFFNVIDIFDTINIVTNSYDTISIFTYDTVSITLIDTIFDIINVYDTVQIIDTQQVVMAIDSCSSLVINTGNECLLKIFPNPLSNHNLIISDLCENESWDKIEITDVLSRQVFLYEGAYQQNYTANLMRIPAGTYFLNLYKDGFLIRSTKLIVNKS